MTSFTEAVGCRILYPVILLAALLAPVLARSADNIQLPTLGDGSEMSSNVERRLGDRIAREIYRDPDYIDDPVLVDYVQGVWQPLLAAARLRGDLSSELRERFAWEVMLGRDRTVNAFALPGGYFGVHLGLLAVVGSRDELASVLGHELSHVTQRHISRVMAKQSQQTPWMIGAMILGALAASKSADAGSALIVGGQAVAAQNQLNFSRDMEREADRIGFGVMTQAGFEAQGFVSMFEKLQQASRLNDSGAYPYLRSHPLTTERIADMQGRQPLGAGNGPRAPPTLEHAIMTARARVLSNPGVDALRAIAAEAVDNALTNLPPVRQVEVLYGATLSASRLREFSSATQSLTRLAARVQGDARAMLLSHWLGVEVALAAGENNRAAALLDQVAASPDLSLRRPQLFLRAQAALQSGDVSHANEVAQDFQIWVLAHPRDATAWQSLSGLYALQGQSLRSIRADAEAQVARLDYTAALERFRAAQELMHRNEAAGAGSTGQDHIESSIVDTRKRQVELLLKEQSLDR
jgi:predicted Zn-dependent protease